MLLFSSSSISISVIFTFLFCARFFICSLIFSLHSSLIISSNIPSATSSSSFIPSRLKLKISSSSLLYQLPSPDRKFISGLSIRSISTSPLKNLKYTLKLSLLTRLFINVTANVNISTFLINPAIKSHFPLCCHSTY